MTKNEVKLTYFPQSNQISSIPGQIPSDLSIDQNSNENIESKVNALQDRIAILEKSQLISPDERTNLGRPRRPFKAILKDHPYGLCCPCQEDFEGDCTIF